MLAGLTALLGGGNGGGGSFESIATFTAAGGEANATFSSIVGTYKHLQIRGISRGGTGAGQQGLRVQFNADTAANYVYHALTGNGTAASASGATAQTGIYVTGSLGNGEAASLFGTNIIDIHDYSNTSKNKTVRAFTGADINTASTSYTIDLSSGLWLNTAAITQVLIKPNSGTFAAGTTFALYGIKG